MALIYRTSCYFQASVRHFHATCTLNLIQKWRIKSKLPLNPNAYGPLTDLQDYSYIDGRPTPLGMRQSKRRMKQKEILSSIIHLSQEMDSAVVRYNAIVEEEKRLRQERIASKLKPKGFLLNKK